MGIWAAIKRIFTSSEPQEVKNTSPVNSVSNEPLPLVNKESLESQGNEDKAEIKTHSRNDLYKKIEDICVEYRMNLDDVKKVGLLEQIAGCSTEDLLKKSDGELDVYIDALKHTLKYLSWKLPWNDRNIDDINKIAKQANERIIYKQTGRSFIGNMFRSRSNLSEKLSTNGYSLDEKGVKAYFENLISNAVATGDREKIKEAYDNALIIFGDLLNDTESPEDKRLLTAAIEKLQSGKRALAAKLTITSCRNEENCVHAAARGIAEHYEGISCTRDRLGEYTSDIDNTSIAHISFANMTQEDSELTLAEMKARRMILEEKIRNGESLSESELRYYNNAQISQYAGAMTGTACNSYIENRERILSIVNNDTQEFGIQEQVYSQVNQYIDSNPELARNATPELTKIIAEASEARVVSAGDTTTTSPKESKNTQAETNASTQAPESPVQEKQNVKSLGQTPSHTRISIDRSNNPLRTTSDKEAPSAIKPDKGKVNLTEAIKKGIKEAKEFAKENHISRFDMAIEILNTTSDKSSEKWALNQFELMNDSLQKINFFKIEKADTALKAARLMNPEALRDTTTFRNYYIRNEVEKIKKEETC